MRKIDSITDDEFMEIVKKNRFIKEICCACGYSVNSGGGKIAIRNRMKELDIVMEDTHNWRFRKPLQEILVENSPWLGTAQKLKIRLIEELGWEDRCLWCGISEQYNGKPIVLQLDHINGNNRDNRLENLRILCPNCHSQTHTYGHKKREAGLIR